MIPKTDSNTPIGLSSWWETYSSPVGQVSTIPDLQQGNAIPKRSSWWNSIIRVCISPEETRFKARRPVELPKHTLQDDFREALAFEKIKGLSPAIQERINKNKNLYKGQIAHCQLCISYKMRRGIGLSEVEEKAIWMTPSLRQEFGKEFLLQHSETATLDEVVKKIERYLPPQQAADFVLTDEEKKLFPQDLSQEISPILQVILLASQDDSDFISPKTEEEKLTSDEDQELIVIQETYEQLQNNQGDFTKFLSEVKADLSSQGVFFQRGVCRLEGMLPIVIQKQDFIEPMKRLCALAQEHINEARLEPSQKKRAEQRLASIETSLKSISLNK